MQRLLTWLAACGKPLADLFPGALTSALPAPLARAWSTTLYERDTRHHRIRVEETREQRLLYFDGTLQSSMNRKDPRSLELVYSRFASLGLVLPPDAAKVLFIGLGGGSMARTFHQAFPDMDIDIVEIDPEVVEVAREFFDFREDPRQRIHTGDGRAFLARTGERFDLILLDAYYADNMPFHLITREFLATARERLSAEGALAVNLIGTVRGPDSAFVRAAVKTLAGVFPQVYTFATFGNRGRVLREIQNVVTLASKAGARMSVKEMEHRAMALDPGGRLFPEPPGRIRRCYLKGPLEQDDVEPLADEDAPMDDRVRL